LVVAAVAAVPTIMMGKLLVELVVVVMHLLEIVMEQMFKDKQELPILVVVQVLQLAILLM
jgi:hypothetical protein